MTKPMNLIIETLSPVHIGDGLEYDPVDYVITDDKMVFYDPLRLSKSIFAESEQKFRDYCGICKNIKFDNKESLNRFRQSIEPYLNNAADFSISLTPAALSKFHIDKKATPVSSLIKNRFERLPYIPGSTVKGLLKTIIMWKFFADQGIKNIPALPSGNDDPWRLVDVSDFQAVRIDSVVDVPINLHNSLENGKRKISGIPAPLELINTGSMFLGSISFNESLHKIALEGDDNFSKNVRRFFPEPLAPDYVKSAIKEFGDKLFTKEYQKFGSTKSFAQKNELEKPFGDWWSVRKDESEKEHYRLIKLGKHAGAISKMIYGGDDLYKGIRNVAIPQQKSSQHNDTQTTVWLSSSGFPLGWAKVLFLNDENLVKAKEMRKKLLAKKDVVEAVDKKAESQPQKELTEWEKKLALKGKKIPGRR